MTGPGGYNQPPESFGPDPYGSHTQPYAPQQPYGNQPYGQDPYYSEPYPSYGPYNQDPYAQPDPYGYPQYQTGGFPPPPPPEPPKRSKVPMILSLVAIVIIVGAVVTIVLLNRNDPQPTAGGGSDKSSSSPKDEPSSKKSDPSGGGGGNTDDWLTIDNTDGAGLTYQVPPDWKESADPKDSGFEGLPFSGAAEYGVYDCEGASYVRTFATSGSVQGKDGAEIGLEDTVKDFANSFSTTYYGAQATIELAEPEKTEVDGKEALMLTAKVTPQVSKPDCEAAEAEVAVIGVLLESEGKPAGVAMLVVVNDTKGGPQDPAPAPASIGKDILATVKTG